MHVLIEAFVIMHEREIERHPALDPRPLRLSFYNCCPRNTLNKEPPKPTHTSRKHPERNSATWKLPGPQPPKLAQNSRFLVLLPSIVKSRYNRTTCRLTRAHPHIYIYMYIYMHVQTHPSLPLLINLVSTYQRKSIAQSSRLLYSPNTECYTA